MKYDSPAIGIFDEGQGAEMTRLLTGYNMGFSVGVRVYHEVLTSALEDLKNSRVQLNDSRLRLFNRVFIENRDKFREPDFFDFYRPFIRWNKEKKDFEYWQEVWEDGREHN